MAKSGTGAAYPLKQRRHASGTHHNGDITRGQTTSLTRYQSIDNKSGQAKMINRQQGFTLLEVMAALAISQCLACWRL